MRDDEENQCVSEGRRLRAELPSPRPETWTSFCLHALDMFHHANSRKAVSDGRKGNVYKHQPMAPGR